MCSFSGSAVEHPARNAQRILSQRLKNELEVKQEIKVEEVKIESSDDERLAGCFVFMFFSLEGSSKNGVFFVAFTAGNG